MAPRPVAARESGAANRPNEGESMMGMPADNRDSVAGVQDCGARNPNAPMELEQFSFLLGDWAIEGERLAPRGEWEAFTATMRCRYILDGYCLMDEYRQYDGEGGLSHFGATYRSYNAQQQAWVMKFHDALHSTWLDLGPPELGGVRIDDAGISYQHTIDPRGLVRITFRDIEDDSYAWRAEVTQDRGQTWNEVMRYTAGRKTGKASR